MTYARLTPLEAADAPLADRQSIDCFIDAWNQLGEDIAQHGRDIDAVRAAHTDSAPAMLDAAKRLLAVFDQQRMTTAERIITGVSDSALRTEGQAAMEALRAAVELACPTPLPSGSIER